MEVVEVEVVEVKVSGDTTTTPLADVSTAGLIEADVDTEGAGADDFTDDNEWLGGIVCAP